MEKRAPIVFGKLATEAAFTNRTEELNYLLQNFQSGINTILISPRRWGKSSLVLKATEKIESRKIRTCSFDMFNTRSQEEFYEQLSQSVISATSGKISEFVENTKEYIGKFIPKINLANEANQEISLSLDWEEIRKDPTDILNLAEKIAARKNIKIIICIDEFQNIGNFEHAVDFQKKLRAAWQRHKHVTYCLYGSKRHMMMDVFTKPSMPFYKFGDLIFLEKIKIQDWKSSSSSNLPIRKRKYLLNWRVRLPNYANVTPTTPSNWPSKPGCAPKAPAISKTYCRHTNLLANS
jgi:AAA+ ATPase superfamily predicted ATPase